MCKKQTSVSHSSKEAEIISLDTGLRLDGLLALELWDLIVSVFGSVSQVSDRSGQPDNDINKHHKSQKRTNVMENIDSVPSNVQSSRQEALLYVFGNNETVIKMIIKGRSPTMRHVSRTHRVALDWLFDRINLDSKIQIKYIDTKNKLADILTKGSFTRDEWNHLLCLFNISHFSPTVSFAAMAKGSQQDSEEERVKAKSKPMMNLIPRTSSFVSSSTSVSPGKTYYGKQDPWSSVVAKDRSGQSGKETESSSSTDYSKLDYDRIWSSQEWKSDELMEDRTGRPVVNAQHTDRFIVENDEMNSYAEAQSELSLGSRSFLHRKNDQVRKRQNQSSKDATKDSDKHSVIWQCLCLPHCKHLYPCEKSTYSQILYTREIYWTDHLHVDVQRHLMEI